MINGRYEVGDIVFNGPHKLLIISLYYDDYYGEYNDVVEWKAVDLYSGRLFIQSIYGIDLIYDCTVYISSLGNIFFIDNMSGDGKFVSVI